MLALFRPMRFGPVGQSIPAAVCVVFLVKLWWAGELYGVRGAGLIGWFLIAVAIQLASDSPATWIAGYVGQAALGVVLVLKDQWDV